MAAYFARRVLVSVFLAWGVLTLVFLLVDALPGDPFHELVGPGTSPEAADRLRALFGTERALSQRYASWLGGLLQGDLGLSMGHRVPVAELLHERIGHSLLLATLALIAQFTLGTAAGVVAARYRFSRIDRGIETIAGLVYALPSFCTALLLVGIFAVGLGWLPATQMESIDALRMGAWTRRLDHLRHLLLPTIALALPLAGGLTLYVRDQLDSILDRPFVQAAHARGVSSGRVLLHHALRNCLVPLTQLLGLSLPGLVGGGVVVEVLFAWPGMGRLAYDAVLARDLPLVLGCTLVGTWAVILGSLVADLSSAAADPRLREALR